jgi:hypothetical protein
MGPGREMCGALDADLIAGLRFHFIYESLKVLYGYGRLPAVERSIRRIESKRQDIDGRLLDGRRGTYQGSHESAFLILH